MINGEEKPWFSGIVDTITVLCFIIGYFIFELNVESMISCFGEGIFVLGICIFAFPLIVRFILLYVIAALLSPSIESDQIDEGLGYGLAAAVYAFIMLLLGAVLAAIIWQIIKGR